MLYGLDWLDEEQKFPPDCEGDRLDNYARYRALFDLDRFESFNREGCRLIANFDEYFKLPLLLGYQRLSTIKLADMILGAPPSIGSNTDDELTSLISDIRDQTNFNEKLYQSIIDFSRYGVTVFRLFNDDEVEEDRGNFAVWDPAEWFPILRKDGTKRIKEHLLVWRVNFGDAMNPDWYLEIQRHPVEGGHYFEMRYRMDSTGSYVQKKMFSKKIDTAGAPCLVQHVANLPSTSNVYGTSDYRVLNELVIKATERIRQILYILDKHADPSMTGPTTMLTANEQGELEFKAAKFYATIPGEEHPEYLTWNGQLEAAFKALEVLLNQIYIFSEMGEAFLGNSQGTGNAISGTALRYKMLSPLEKARRVSNSFTLPLKKLISALIYIGNNKKVRYQDINITWEDSLPKDPSEVASLTRLQTGAPQIIPLKHALMENYGMDAEAAEHFIEEINKDQETWQKLKVTEGTGQSRPGEANNPAAPPNPTQKTSINQPSKTGTQNVKNRSEDTE